jgi:Tfp pilus assembly major pilin PilA
MHAPADDPSEALYRAAIGPRNTDFYLSKFRRFDEPGSSKLSWNWPAFFFFVGWFAYRRMFLEWGLYCLVIPIAMRLAAGIASRAVGLHTGHLIYDAASLAYAFLVIPLYANAMYWRAVRRRIDSVKREVDTPANQMAVLETGPHTSILWWVPVALVGVAIVGLLAARAIPRYKAYVARAQVVEGLRLTAQLRAVVARYHAAHHSWPASLADLGMATPLRSRAVSDVSVDRGTITIHYGAAAIEGVASQSLSLTPTLADHEQVRWVCGRGSSAGDAAGANQTTLAEGYLPPVCRHNEAAATH